MLLLPLYFQELRGTTVLTAGLLLVPQGLGTLASRPLAGRLSDRMGARWLAVAGFFTALLGTLPFALAGAHASYLVLMAALLVRGFGLSLVMVPLMALAFRGLQRDEVPDASVITRIGQQVGGSFGTAVLAVILTAATATATSTTGLAGAFQQSFWWATGFAAAGVVLSLALPGKLRDTPLPAGEDAPAEGHAAPSPVPDRSR